MNYSGLLWWILSWLTDRELRLSVTTNTILVCDGTLRILCWLF